MGNVERDSLDIIFRRISPEALKDALIQSIASRREPEISVSHIGLKVFEKYSHQNFTDTTADEVENIYNSIEEKMCAGEKKRNIFNLLAGFSKRVLDVEKGDPVCDKTHILRWRDITLRLGQDLFTTSFLAEKDCKYGRWRTYFAWPPVIRSNSAGIRELMKHGLSENHSHLNGAVPVFQLTWLSLMNHPNQAFVFERDIKKSSRFEVNLEPAPMQSHDDYQMSWSERIQLAAWIRVKLFFHLTGWDEYDDSEISYGEEYDRENYSTRNRRNPIEAMDDFLANKGSRNFEVCELTNEARFLYGKKVSLSDGSRKCLDYFYENRLKDRHNEGYHRLLVGERYFLYSCFYLIFDHDKGFGTDWQNLFYLYLLLKNSLRSEIVQVNKRIGFRNFSAYQNRKTMFWEKYNEYWAEGYRMAINGSIRDNHLNSLEVRIMPANTKKELMHTIYQTDRETYFARRNYPGDGENMELPEKRSVLEAGKKMEYFYVIHFPKKKMKKAQMCGAVQEKSRKKLSPRNQNVRSRTRRQALSLAEALAQNGYLCRRIRGIDGCSAEIGCRPETFATEFRFLRHFVPLSESRKIWEKESRVQPLLSATYHVGEDFLDIANGLRAIDEAVLFLNLKRGDRLGHALALGVEPEPFYSLKSRHLVLPKQDRLDDLVWLLFRSRELDIPVPPDLEAAMTREAKSLQEEIYGDCIRENHWRGDLQEYYEAWHLRGDYPSRYHSQPFSGMGKQIKAEQLTGGVFSLRNQYSLFQINTKPDVIKTETNCGLYHYYQFGSKERVRGQETTNVKITPEYADLIRRMQDGMIKFLIEKGIYIECNPSSNLLIGTFQRYEEHPVFRFNRFDLDERYRNVDQLCVSVNTDDQGIFDTSLENEYALLASALEKQKKEDGMQKYSSSAILQYLYNLRAMGEMQVFPEAFQPEGESWKRAQIRDFYDEDEKYE